MVMLNSNILLSKQNIRHPYPINANHSSSVRTFTPAASAFLSLDHTLPETFAPRDCARALASSREKRSSLPVKTTIFPATGESDIGASAS